MRLLALLLLLPCTLKAQVTSYNPSPAIVFESSLTATQNGATSSAFTNAPIEVLGNANTFIQEVIQNQSNGTNATSDLVVTDDLGTNTSFYGEFGINSSKFSNSYYSAEPSSAVFMASSDSDLFIWSDINGTQNGGVNGRIVFGSSAPTTGNIAAQLLPSNTGVGAWLFASSVTFNNNIGVSGTNKVGIGTVSPASALHLSSGVVTLDGNGAKVQVSSGTALTVTSCGTGPDLASAGFGLTDIAGRFKIGAAGSTVCQINFQTAYTNVPICFAQDETNATVIKPTPSTGNLILTATIAAADIVDYWCIGRR